MAKTKLADLIKSKLDYVKSGKQTATGSDADEIKVHPSTGPIKEETEKKAVFTFGRFNPPTTGHQKLIDSVKKIANTHGAEHHVFASQSQDPKKNPLPHSEKVRHMKKMFPDTNIHSDGTVRNVIDAAKHLQSRGVTHGTLVVGSDRVDEFHNLLSKYNKHPDSPDYDPKKHFYIPHLTVVSAGQRDPDAEGVEGMSASKLRDHAKKGNFEEFKKGVPQPQHARSMYNSLRKHMGINEETESPTTAASRMLRARAEKERQDKKKDKLASARHEDEAGDSIAKNGHTKNSHNQPMGSSVSSQYKEETTPIHKKITNSYKKVTKPTINVTLPADMTQNPYEETIPTPYEREGDKPVDIGTDKDLGSSNDTQIRRRKSLKLFRAFREDAYDPGSSVPTPVDVPGAGPPGESSKVKNPKQRIKNSIPINTNPVKETYTIRTPKRGTYYVPPGTPRPNLNKSKAELPGVIDQINKTFGKHLKKEDIGVFGTSSCQQADSNWPTGTKSKPVKKTISVKEGMFGDPINMGGIPDKPTAFPDVQAAVPPVVNSSKKKTKAPQQPAVQFPTEEKHGLWYNIHAKQERIKHGSGEHMRKPGSKGAPTAANFKSAQESVDNEIDEHIVKIGSQYRLVSKKSGKNLGTYSSKAGAEKRERQVQYFKHHAEEAEYIEERGADSKGYFRSTESGAGLTKKGVAHFRAKNPGSKLQTAVTGKVKPGSKAAKRRKSFCARMSGMPGPMKDEKGRPTRKAMSLRRWRCRT